jgi:asparagine synthase (glutamine-hydrolysing)
VADVDLARSLSANLPRPNARAFTQSGDKLSLRHARAIGADAFASGGGGDDAFCYLRNVLPAIDRLQAEGVRAMLATARDIAVMNHSTFWQAMSRIARRLRRGASSRQGPDLRFLAPGLEVSCEGAEPVEARRIPGKADHVRGVLTIHNYLEGHERASFAPILSPLLSQPIVECCLSIPTWNWCAGGRNRAVAREAFSGRLPRMVMERRSKGSFDAFSALLLQANLDLVRDMLLHGELAAREMLDRKAIQAALDAPSPPAESVTRLLALVDVESWVQSWKRRQPAG